MLWNFVEFVVSRRCRGSWDSRGSAYFGEYDGNYGVLGCLQGVFCGFVELCGIVPRQGLNQRPSACEADVITTRPQVFLT